MFGKTIIQTDI